METKILSLLSSRPLLTVWEAANSLDVPEQEVQPVFAAIASGHAGSAYALLSGAVDDAAHRHSTRIALQKVESSADDTAVFALMPLSFPKPVTASSVPAQLRPAEVDALRVYPVVSRSVMEARKDDAAAAPLPAAQCLPVATPTTVPRTPPAKLPAAAVKIEKTDETVPMARSAVAPVVAVAAAASPLPKSPAVSAPSPTEPSPAPSLQPARETVVAPHTAEVSSVVESSAPSVSVAPPAVLAAAATDATSPASPSTPAVVAAPSRKPTIFDKMKEAAASKRPREEDESSAKPKRAAAKPKKEPKAEQPTTSLAKLARASKKKKGGAAPVSPPPSMSFLDEDDGDAVNELSRSEESTSAEPIPIPTDETPAFDVVEVSASNDEVILCDDAPPLAFRPAQPVPPTASATSPTKRDPAAVTKANAAAAAADAGATQSTLGSFFNSAVVGFQRSYVRDVQTEMKVEDGEYICVDVTCYKHKTTGEIISEEEYHRQSVQLARDREATAGTPTHRSAGALTEASPSPAATAKAASRGPVDKASKEKAAPTAPGKTLLSFFKSTTVA